jgi:hypothetical protein
VHSTTTVAEVLALRQAGLGARRIARQTTLPLGTVRDWLEGRLPKHFRSFDRCDPVVPSCVDCGHPSHRFDDLPPEYVYLLGLYLGDGCISRHARNVFRLRVFLDLKYPEIVNDCEAAMRLVAPRSSVHRIMRRGGAATVPEVPPGDPRLRPAR